MTTKEPRIGVFVCKCGTNIAKVVDVPAVAEYAKSLPYVEYAGWQLFTCSEEGQNTIKNTIKKHKLNRVIVASCSPKLHEPTFRRTVMEAGVNPFFFEMVNIREQVSWAHMKQKDKYAEATQKAKDLVRAGVFRASQLESIGSTTQTVPPVCMVIGAGIAGITASTLLADEGYEVHLVERSPALGGKAAQLGFVFMTDTCGVCVPPRHGEMARKCLSKRVLLDDPKIRVYTRTEVKQFSGYIGNFQAKLHTKPRGVNANTCTLCGLCMEICPIEIPHEHDFGMGIRKAIYTPFPQAVPRTPVVDFDNCTKCGKCVAVCPVDAINLEESPREKNLTVGTVIVATGFDVFKPEGLYGYNEYQNVTTQMALARMLDPLGPTSGKLQRLSDKTIPKHVGMIQCVGSRNPEYFTHCSRVCCQVALKHAVFIKEKWPTTDVTIFYKDIRLQGKEYERYYLKAQKLGVNFHRAEISNVTEGKKNSLELTVEHQSGKKEMVPVDLLVLSAAMAPAEGAKELAHTLNLEVDLQGFFREYHLKLAPVDTTTDGIYLAGACSSPRDIAEASFMGAAAASHAAIPMSKGEVEVDLAKSIVDESICIGCANCFAVCPYSAIRMEGGVAKVVEVACKGCGICVVECPAEAIQLRHYRDKQIYSQIEGLLANVGVTKK
ncbi:MAG: 4Fe-4S binding protein [Candidatus Thorarchaeota archaeon]